MPKTSTFSMEKPNQHQALLEENWTKQAMRLRRLRGTQQLWVDVCACAAGPESQEIQGMQCLSLCSRFLSLSLVLAESTNTQSKMSHTR